MSTILSINKSFKIYIPKKVNGIRIRNICNWFENGEKPTKFFLNLEKYRATQGCLSSYDYSEQKGTKRFLTNK